MAGAGTLPMSSRHAANKTASSSTSPPTPSPLPSSYQQASYLLHLALRSTPLSHQHRRGMRLIRRVTFGSLGTDLPVELRPDDLDEPSRLGGTNAQPNTQGIGRYRLLMGGAMSCILSPRLRQKHLRRTLGGGLGATPSRNYLVLELRLCGIHPVIRLLLDKRFWSIDISCDRHWTRIADRLQEAGANFRPADQQKRPNCVERRLPVLTRNERLCHVQREGDHAGEDQQPTRWLQYLYGGTSACQVPRTKQKSEDRKIDCRRYKRGHPGRYTKPKSEIEDIAEAEEER
jgi:hypothetical protein